MTYFNPIDHYDEIKIQTKSMFPNRKLEKEISRKEDERLLSSGEMSKDEMQRVNGGFGIFRNSTIKRLDK